MPKVRRSSDAENDLLEIYLYIGRENQSLAAADRLLLAIHEKCQQYALHPEMGTLRPDLGPEIRVFLCGTKANPREWVAIYRPSPNGIELLRVFRSNRDYPTLFNG